MKHAEAIAHYITLLPEFIEDADFFEAKLEREGPGRHLSTLHYLASSKQAVAIITFLKDGDVGAFRRSAAKKAAVRLMRFEAFDRGEEIDESHVTMLAYIDVLAALSVADFELATKLCKVMGGRPGIEKANNTPADRALGYLIKSVLTGDDPEAIRERIEELRRVSESSKAARAYTGYVGFFEALVTRDEIGLKVSFERIMTDHRRSAVRGGVAADNFGDAISLRGLGLVNYARHLGFTLKPDDVYVPKALIS